MRLAQTLAVSESQPLTGITEEHVLMCIELAMQFVQQTSDMSYLLKLILYYYLYFIYIFKCNIINMGNGFYERKKSDGHR